ncbi:GDSL/SGNH-like acyl-esterase family found in Pmr5 and Cas1p-domain-containing protein, partial [Endogone sp. FLAS-F59071]
PLDRNHCQSLLTEGWWLDTTFKNWQPAGCMMQTYKATDTTRCLANSHVLFVGDSIVRGQLLAMAKKIDPNVTIGGEPHSDRLFQVSSGISLEFWWDPFLNTTHTLQLLQGTAQIHPSLLVIGSGLWYLGHAKDSGGAPAWRTTIDRVVSQITDPALAPKIASTILLAPVETPEISLLNPTRLSLLSPSGIASMNDHLQTYSHSVAIPFAWNRMVEQSTLQTEDGLHFGDLVSKNSMVSEHGVSILLGMGAIGNLSSFSW